MPGLKRLLSPVVAVLLAGCFAHGTIVRDDGIVDQYRVRIAKVQNAIDETRDVLAATRQSPHNAELQLRLAELLSEEARYHYMVAVERGTGAADVLHVPQVVALKEEAIATYQGILIEHGEVSFADRVRFNVGHEYRELGRFEEMEVALQALIDSGAQGSFRDEALLILGDYRFDKAEFAAASRYYTDLTQSSLPHLRGMAHYKMAWIHINQADCDRALVSFDEALAAARQLQVADIAAPPSERVALPAFGVPEPTISDQDTHSGIDVRREALVDLSYCYTQVKEGDDVVAFLRARAANREFYLAALSRMRSRLRIAEEHSGATDVVRELLRLAPDDEERLHDARMLHSLLTTTERYDSLSEDIALILRIAQRRQRLPGLEEEADQLLAEFEILTRDLATRAHRQLKEAEAGDPSQVARAYEAYLLGLPRSAHHPEVVLNLAEVHVEAADHLQAGHRYREAAEMAEAPARAQEHRYAAVRAYQQHLEDSESSSRTGIATARAGLRQAGGDYLRAGVDDALVVLQVKLAIATSHHQEGNHLAATDLLNALVYEYPDTPQGQAAAHLLLDAYRSVDDLEGLIATARRLMAEDSPLPGGFLMEIQPILAAAEQRRIDTLSLSAAGESGSSVPLMEFVARYEDSPLGERALLSAFTTARAQGDTALLYELGEQYLSRYPRSEQSRGVITTMSQVAMGRFELDRALALLERAIQLDEQQAAPLLMTAGQLYAQLGEPESALAALREAERLGSEAEQLAAVIQMAELYAKLSQPSQAARVLLPYRTTADPEVLSRLGEALLQVGEVDAAEAMMLAVLEAPSASSEAMARASFGEAEILLSLLERYQPPEGLAALGESIELIDFVIQASLSAAGQPDPTYSQAALLRLSRAALLGADLLEGLVFPSDLSADDQAVLQESLDARIAQLRSASEEAIVECSRRARTAHILDSAGRSCILNQPPLDAPDLFVALSPRVSRQEPPGVDDIRQRISRNPGDLRAITALGEQYLRSGDVHTARLVLQRVAEQGGGAEELALLGQASWLAGDPVGALNALGRASDAGSPEALQTYAAISAQLGLDAYASELLERAALPPGTVPTASTTSTATAEAPTEHAGEAEPSAARAMRRAPRWLDRVSIESPHIPSEARVWLVESEDEIAVAAARLSEAGEALKAQHLYARRLLQALSGSSLARPFEQHLDDRIESLKAEQALQEQQLRLAEARYDRTRAVLARQYGITAQALEPFERAVAAERDAVQAAEANLEEKLATSEQAAVAAWSAFSSHIQSGGSADAIWR